MAAAEEHEEELEDQLTTPSGRKSAIVMRYWKKKIVEMTQEEIQWPEEACTPVSRTWLIIDDPQQNEPIKGHFDETAALLCVFCSKEASDDEELIDCQGLVNQIHRKIVCRSKFHLKCVMDYHHGAFLFQYAARPECQNKLLCPLHCCTACNSDQRKQTAYEGKLTECAQCLRSFHTDTCQPVGSTPILVELQADERQVQVPMIICPFHAKFVDKKGTKHIRVCMNCTESNHSGLLKCKTCIRMYHKQCRKVTTINGIPAENGVCDHCLGSMVTRFNVPMLARWKTGGFFLCVPRPWDYESAAHKFAHFGEVGYTFVEWVVEEKKWSIVNLSDLCQLTKAHLSIESPDSKEYWEHALEAFDEFARFPPRYKEVHRMGKASKHYDKAAIKLYQFHENGICACVGQNRCTTDDCIYVAAACECPPQCTQNGRICNNRNVSEHKEHQNMQLRKAGVKGFGVFAKGPIKKGDFLAEYVGELINKAEKDKRLLSVTISKDHEANRYMMDCNGGLTIDATRYGNMTRYINHSCEPNAGCYQVKIFIKNDADDEHSWFEYRVFIRAERDIDEDEEITFDYGMVSDQQSVPDCKCGSVGCTGRLMKKKDREAEEQEEEPAIVVAVPKKKRSRQSTTTQQANALSTTTPRKRRRRSDAGLQSEAKRRRVSRPEGAPEAAIQAPEVDISRSRGLQADQNPPMLAPEAPEALPNVPVSRGHAQNQQLEIQAPEVVIPVAPEVVPNVPTSRGRARNKTSRIRAPKPIDTMPILEPNLPIIESSQGLQNQIPPALETPEAPINPFRRRRSVAVMTRQRPRITETPVARDPRVVPVIPVPPESANQII